LPPPMDHPDSFAFCHRTLHVVKGRLHCRYEVQWWRWQF